MSPFLDQLWKPVFVTKLTRFGQFANCPLYSNIHTLVVSPSSLSVMEWAHNLAGAGQGRNIDLVTQLQTSNKTNRTALIYNNKIMVEIYNNKKLLKYTFIQFSFKDLYPTVYELRELLIYIKKLIAKLMNLNSDFFLI